MNPKIPISINFRTFAVADVVAGVLVTLLAFFLSPYSQMVAVEQSRHTAPLTTAILLGIITTLTAHVFGLHDPRSPKTPTFLASRAYATTLVSLTVLVLIFQIVTYQQIGRYILLQVALYLPPLLIAIRWLFHQGHLFNQRRIGVIGSIEELERIKAELPTDSSHLQLLFQTQDLTSIQELCNLHAVNELVICRDLTSAEMAKVLEFQCSGIHVRSLPSFEEATFFRIPHDRISAQWFLYTDLTTVNTTYRALKRLSDVALSLSGALVVLPVLPVLIALIKWESPGSAFFSQTRTGENGRPFKLWKLRSMKTDAEKNGPQFAVKADQRVTKLGKFLRKSRLDETPQFWNIFKGDMSFIGPRPERPEFVTDFCKVIPFYQQRHSIKPGLTGWAQINYPYGATTEDAAKKLQFDLFYVKHMSPLLDFQIILRTIGAFMKGAR